jgi:hypothetical protein
MHCPKWGFEQEAGEECTRCGVIFARVPPSEHAPVAAIPQDEARPRNTGRPILLAMLLLALVFLFFHMHRTRELTYPPGVLIGSQPQQVVIKNPVPWKKGNRLIYPLARFNLQARVLGKESYRSDAGADISPYDLALGWGPMSDQKVLDRLEIVQGNRRFVIMPIDGVPPLPLGALMASSSNMHILPANPAVGKDIGSLRVGSLVELSGYLVGVRENGQWTWVSSLTRTDSGDGACEVFWVERVQAL